MGLRMGLSDDAYFSIDIPRIRNILAAFAMPCVATLCASRPVTITAAILLSFYLSLPAFSSSSVTRHSSLSASRVHASPATRASCNAPRPTIPAPFEPSGRSSPWLGAPLPSVCGIVFASGALSEFTAIFDARTRARLARMPLWIVCPSIGQHSQS